MRYCRRCAPQRPTWSQHDNDDFIAAPFNRRDLLGCIFELLQRGGGIDHSRAG